MRNTQTKNQRTEPETTPSKLNRRVVHIVQPMKCMNEKSQRNSSNTYQTFVNALALVD